MTATDDDVHLERSNFSCAAKLTPSDNLEGFAAVSLTDFANIPEQYVSVLTVPLAPTNLFLHAVLVYERCLLCTSDCQSMLGDGAGCRGWGFSRGGPAVAV